MRKCTWCYCFKYCGETLALYHVHTAFRYSAVWNPSWRGNVCTCTCTCMIMHAYITWKICFLVMMHTGPCNNMMLCYRRLVCPPRYRILLHVEAEMKLHTCKYGHRMWGILSEREPKVEKVTWYSDWERLVVKYKRRWSQKNIGNGVQGAMWTEWSKIHPKQALMNARVHWVWKLFVLYCVAVYISCV